MGNKGRGVVLGREEIRGIQESNIKISISAISNKNAIRREFLKGLPMAFTSFMASLLKLSGLFRTLPTASGTTRLGCQGGRPIQRGEPRSYWYSTTFVFFAQIPKQTFARARGCYNEPAFAGERCAILTKPTLPLRPFSAIMYRRMGMASLWGVVEYDTEFSGFNEFTAFQFGQSSTFAVIYRLAQRLGASRNVQEWMTGEGTPLVLPGLSLRTPIYYRVIRDRLVRLRRNGGTSNAGRYSICHQCSGRENRCLD